MNIEEGKEEPWKRGKVKCEQREREMTIEMEKEKPQPKYQTASDTSFLRFVQGFAFPTLLANPSPFAQVWPSLSSMLLHFPLKCSSLSSLSSAIVLFCL